jgi:hypothetical protein
MDAYCTRHCRAFAGGSWWDGRIKAQNWWIGERAAVYWLSCCCDVWNTGGTSSHAHQRARKSHTGNCTFGFGGGKASDTSAT